MNKRFKFLYIGFCLIIITMSCTETKKNEELAEDIKQESLTVLRDVLYQQNEWVKVHAAEFLLWSGYPENVRDIYLKEEIQYGTQPKYRIGIWRVLAQAVEDTIEKKRWTDKILGAFLDEKGQDRIHAAETLAKLGISPLHADEEVTRRAIASSVKSLSLYTLWSVSYTSQAMKDSVTKEMMASVLSADEAPAVTNQASYIIRQLGGLSVPQWEQLAQEVVQGNRKDNINLLSALFIHAADPVKNSEVYQKIHQTLVNFKTSDSKGERSEMTYAFGKSGTKEDLPVLLGLLRAESPLQSEEDNEDVKASAAYGLLLLNQKIKSSYN